MERLVDKNHLMYQKVQKVFDLMKKLKIEFYVDSYNDLRIIDKETEEDNFKIVDFEEEGFHIPMEDFKIHEDEEYEDEEENEEY